MFNLGNNVFKGTLTIYPIAADLHHDTDEFTKMDPYCIFIHGQQHYKTNVCKHGGKKPHWNDCITFECSTNETIFIELKDHNTFGSDTIIAAADIKINHLVENNCTLDDWITVYYKMKPCGTLHVKATFQSQELITFQMGGNLKMDVNIMGNQQQFNMNSFGNQNQYNQNINFNNGNQFQQQQQFNMNTNFNQNQIQFQQQNLNNYNTMNQNVQETIKFNQFGQEEIVLKEGHKHHHHNNNIQETVKFNQFGQEEIIIKDNHHNNNGFNNFGNEKVKETIQFDAFGNEIIKEKIVHNNNNWGNNQVKEEVFINPNGTETIVIEEKHKHKHHHNW